MVRTVILAAGASLRMGRPKAGLPIGHSPDTFLARIIRTCLTAGLPDLVVVSGAHHDAVCHAAGPTRTQVRIVHNPHWERGQLSSLLTGMDLPPGNVIEAVLMTLVDLPLISADTYARVVRTWRDTRAPIVRPARGELHGHPVIFDRAVFDQLRGADPERGAKAVVRAHASALVNVPIDDPGAYDDVDTPQEYEAMTRQAAQARRQGPGSS